MAGNRLLAEGVQIDSKEGRIGVSAQDVTIKDARTRTQDRDSETNARAKPKAIASSKPSAKSAPAAPSARATA